MYEKSVAAYCRPSFLRPNSGFIDEQQNHCDNPQYYIYILYSTTPYNHQTTGVLHTAHISPCILCPIRFRTRPGRLWHGESGLPSGSHCPCDVTTDPLDDLPSGNDIQKAMENGHRNSGLSQL